MSKKEWVPLSKEKLDECLADIERVTGRGTSNTVVAEDAFIPEAQSIFEINNALRHEVRELKEIAFALDNHIGEVWETIDDIPGIDEFTEDVSSVKYFCDKLDKYRDEG